MAEDFFLFPVSFAQQQLWFLDQLVPGSPVYNLPGAIHFKGELNIPALEQSLNEIVRRHEILRTNFKTVDGQPAQLIAPVRSLTLYVTDLRDLPPNEREDEGRRMSIEEGRRPFDLARDTLLRARLLRLAGDEHVLLLTSHHIVSDGWSLGVFLRELAALYESFNGGKPSPLPELAIQYGDFVIWQRDSLKDELLQSHLDYWKQQLGGDLPLQELPFDHPRPAIQTAHGARREISLPGSLTASLKALCQQEGTTIFTALLAAFKVLLQRYAGQTETIVGTPIAGRHQTETENLIGLFVNTLVLRTNLGGDPNFIEVLRRVKEVSLAAYEHQDVPFEKLVEELQPERDLSRMPLFQVMFTFQHAPMPSLELAGVTLKLLEVDIGTAKFDLALNMTENTDGIEGYFEYNTDLFEADTMARLCEHFQTLLSAIVANPRRPISTLPLLSSNELHRQLYEWNSTRSEYPTACLHELFEAQVGRTPDATALVYEGQALSYGELNERANRLAHYLRALGVGAETLVAVLMERSPEMVVGLLGALKAGAAYVPLDPEYPRERLAFMLGDASAPVLLTQEGLLGAVPGGEAEVVCVDGRWPAIAEQSGENPVSTVGPDNLAYVIYTSGSTGQPKGTMLPHSGVVNCLWWMQDTFHLSSDDRVMLKASLSFDASVWELFWPLLVGACVVVAQPGGQQDGAYLVSSVIKHGVTTIHFVPSMLPIFLERRELTDVRSLKRVICGGEALPVESLERFFNRSTAALHNFYGPTETSIGSIDWPCERGLARPTVPIGRPIFNTDVYILDHSLQPVPVSAAGELYIGGAGVARGYRRRAGQTAERFIPHPFSTQGGARLYRTGDLARYLADGRIEFLGRVDEQVKIRGFRIELGEIEVVLAEHPQVRECVVLAHETEGGEKKLVAYVVAQTATEVKVSELRRHLQQKLPEYMIPSNFIMLSELPLSPSGKLDRKALPEPDSTRPDLAQGYVSPRTATEELLCGIWSEVLHVERVGVEDNFFELGGHSLLATQVMAQVREVFGVEVALRRLFELPTVADLAVSLEAEMGAGQSLTTLPIKRFARERDLPLSFAQQRLWFLHQLAPENAFYNMTAAVSLHGTLNRGALERTLNEVVRRHEALRTNFVSLNGRPAQVIAQSRSLNLPVLDIGGFSAQRREVEVRRLTTEEANNPFDLSRDPLLRARLLRLSDTEHVLLITLHHIVGDGWSVNVFINEVAALYEAFSAGKESPLPDLPIQYADYAQWQRQWLQGERLEQQLAYWTRQLADLPEIALPLDRPRPPTQTFRGAVYTIALDSELSEALNALSRREGATLFMTLLAAFKVELYRYTAQDDIVVGSHIANRHRAEIKDLIGFFVNTLVMRTDLSGNPTFLELLQRVREVCLGAYTHQDLPFEKLVEELQPERDPSRQPLFQIAFLLQNIPRAALELPQLSLNLLDIHNRTSKFDLGLELWESPEGLKARFEYNTDLFDEETVARMAEHFHAILRSIASNPNQRIAELPLLSGRERRRQLYEWNDTRSEYPPACLHELFESQAARTPEATALIYKQERLSYRELNERADQLAGCLRGVGVRPETLVAILMERSPEMVVSLLAVLKAGAAYLPLDPNYPQSRLAFMLKDSGVRLLLTDAGLEPRLAEAVNALGVEVLLADGEGLCGLKAAAEVKAAASLLAREENLAYVIYTSGSTGRPKGAMVTHRGVVNCLRWMQDSYGLGEGDAFLFHTPLSFDPSVWELFWPLWVGASVVIAPERRFEARSLAEAIKRYGVTSLYVVPSMLRALLDGLGEVDASGLRGVLRRVICGGESLSAELARRCAELLGAELRHSYGPTETSIAATEWPWRAGDGRARVPIGRPLANTRLYVLDERMEPVPVGVVGELYIGGDGVGRGYLGKAGLTAERFVPDPYGGEAGARLYRTGDMVRYGARGEVEFIGRADEQVKIRGHRIELGEVEAVLKEQEGVRECAVAAREDGEGELRLVAYIVADGARGAAPAESLSGALQAEQVTQWETVFNQTYQQTPVAQDPTFNIVGWKSSYTGLPIPEEEMREWVDSTVEEILSMRPKRVLEIGCGSGLLLFRIAPGCEKYLGTDFSETALRQLERQVREHLPELPPGALLHREADDFAGLSGFDVVVLNSVIQYFPDVEYLVRVLEKAVDAVNEEGFVYIGDVRSMPLLEPFYTSVELYRASPSMSVEELRRRVEKRMHEEEELVIDPRLFVALKDYLPRVAEVEIMPKRGRYHNELTRFRYQVILHVRSKQSEAEDITWKNWQEERLSLTDLRNLLIEHEPEVLGLAGIANARLSTEVDVVETLARMNETDRAGELKELIAGNDSRGIDPESLWQLGAELPYSVSLNWAEHDKDGRYDLILRRRTSAESQSSPRPRFPAAEVSRKSWGEYANDPLRGKYASVFTQQLRTSLKEKLPDYMLPGNFIMLSELPLTPGGKLDRRALPEPDGSRPELAQRYVEARSETEHLLCGIWKSLLRIERVGVEDNFFELGGHSLLATQVMAQVREVFGVEVALRRLFELPTVADLSRLIEAEAGRQQEEQTIAIQPIDREGYLPLSFAQQRLWFLDQLTPHNVAYNIPAAIRLTGSLNLTALQQTFDELVRRHETLRTSFTVVDSQPVQIISAPTPLSLPLSDLSHLAEAERERTVERLVAEEAEQPFDLERSPLLRVHLLRLRESEHVLLFTMHHIVSDGWSLGVLIREVAALYSSFSRGEASPLAELPIQYADYAVWQRERLSGAALAEQVRYWRGRLAGAPPVLELPTDRVRPGVQSYRGGAIRVEIGEETTAALKGLSRREGVTPFMVLLAAFDVLLWRWSGQEDVVVGTPIANRSRSEVEGLIGFFANTLAMRVKLEGNPTFTELLRRVRAVALGAYEHQELPFEKLVEELEPEREMSHTPVFQVMMALQNAPREELVLPGLRLSSFETDNQTSKFDLTLLLEEEGDSISGRLEYNADLFSQETVRRMAVHLQTLLSGIAADAERCISELPLLAEQELEELLYEWNETQADYPDRCSHELFEEQVERTPDAIALIYKEEQLTYRELNERANRLAHYLRGLGVGAESLVGVLMERSVEMVVSLLAVLKAGGAYVPLDPEYPQGRLSYMLSDSQVAVLLTQERMREMASSSGVMLFCVDSQWEAVQGQSVENLNSSVSADNLAYVIYTSGSTGQPKGVAMQHRPLFNLIEWQHSGLKLSHEARTLQVSSLSFDASFNECFATWRSGGPLILISEELRRDPEALLRFIVDQKIERLFLPFVTLQQLAEAFDACGYLPESLREILSTAEQLHVNQAIVHLFERARGCTLYNEYGPSESHVVTAFTMTGDPCDWDALPPIGIPIANTQIHLLDRHLKPVPVGVPGELYIGGVNLARGYLNKPGITAEKFIPNPFGEPGTRLYKTGDLARYLPDGNIKYLGRIDNQVKIHGFRIELGEIEAVLAEHEEVREGVVIARGTTAGDKRLVAYIVAEQAQSPPNASELRAHLKKRLPDYMVPSSFVVLDEMPLTPSGKVDRRALPEPTQFRPELSSEFVAPRTTAEKLLAEMWAHVLKVERVGINDNFFDLGGHSLLATQLMSQVRKSFRTELPLRSLFEEPTVAGLLKELAKAWGEMETVEEIARTLKEIEGLSEETVKTLLSGGAG